MYDSTTLARIINGYVNQCRSRQHKPSYKGIAEVLSASQTTIYNVVHGEFNGGKKYTEHPHSTRVIDNCDFELLRSVFKEGKTWDEPTRDGAI